MSRSYKKAIITISKKLRTNAYRAMRKRVKAKLAKIDLEDINGPDLVDIEADTKELGLEDYGTKLGIEFWGLEKEELKKERRK